MENQINMAKGSWEPLTKETVAETVQWEYEARGSSRLLSRDPFRS